MRAFGILATLAFVLSSVPVAAQGTLNRPLPDPVPYAVDTGWLPNPSGLQRTVHEEEINLPSAGWMRLYFGDVQLEGGSFVRITSLADGEVQELDREALEMWSNTSGYFNGDRIVVELVAGPRTEINRLVVDRLAWEPAVPTGSGCDPGCCGIDDRVPSDEDWVSRLLPAGCTASVYNTDSCVVSAGHCMGGQMVLEFKVPLSNPNCSLNHPPIEDQFPVDEFSFTNGGVGNDWAALTTGTNTLGQTPFERYGEFRQIAPTPPEVGDPVTVWGYGVDNECTLNQAQQTSDGNVEIVGSTLLRYSVDVTFGNSGSGVMRNGEEILGIVTHCCCPNQGTRVDHPSFEAAREALCPSAPPETAGLVSVDVLMGNPVGGSLAQLEQSDDDHFVVDSEQSGVRNNTLTAVSAQSPFSVVSELNVTVELGPADASPVFYSVQLFNNDTGGWESLQFGITSDTNDTVVELEEITSPNDYLDGSGQIRLRLAETAREVQTPGGFTKLIDQVLVTVRP